MAIKTAKIWGLAVPGRPPTPSEGYAQSYARVGPESSQRLITFENGTCLSFGPEDLVDEFTIGHPFSDQIAQVDSAIRDCQSVAQRYQGGNENNHVYNGFRANDPLDRSSLLSIQVGSHTYYQIPSKFATVGTLVPVYKLSNKSDVPGEAHPGFSADTRFGILRNTAIKALEQHIRCETDQERELGIREYDGLERQPQQSGRRNQVVQGGGGNYRQTRRGRRGQRDNQLANEQQPHASGSHELVHVNNRSARVSNPAHHNQGSLQGNGNHEFQPSNGHLGRISNSVLHNQGVIQAGDGLQQFKPNLNQQPSPYIPTSPILLPLGPVSFGGIPFNRHAQYVAEKIMENVHAGAERREFLSTAEILQATQLPLDTAHISHQLHQNGRGRFYDDEPQFVDNQIYQQAARERFHQANPCDNAFSRQPARVDGYSHRHHPTAQRAGREYATFLDEMNQQPLDPETQRPRGDTFHAELAFMLQPPTPTVLNAIAASRATLHGRIQQNSQIFLDSRPVMMSRPGFDSYQNLSPILNDASSFGSEDNSGRSSERASATNQHRSNASSVGDGTLVQPRPLHRSTILGDSGVYSREPSPLAPREASRYFESARSSSGVAGLRALRLDQRSASIGRKLLSD